MIRNSQKLDEFYLELEAREKISHKDALAIFDALHAEAVSLGVINQENIWDGFEVDLKISRAINSV
jgi:hypothetical protein